MLKFGSKHCDEVIHDAPQLNAGCKGTKKMLNVSYLTMEIFIFMFL